MFFEVVVIPYMLNSRKKDKSCRMKLLLLFLLVGIASTAPKPGKKRNNIDNAAKKRKVFKNGPYPLIKRGEIARCVESINSYRRKHERTKDLKWDPELAKRAQEYAEKVLKLIVEQHRNFTSVKNDEERLKQLHLGGNIYYMDRRRIGTCADAVNSWYSEIKAYDFKNHKAKRTDAKRNAFTQLVWRNTASFGIGRAVGDSIRFGKRGNKITVVVANFKQRANYVVGRKAQVGQLI